MKNRKTIRPPSLTRKFLHWYCPEDYLEEIEGDLSEEFNENLLKNRFIANIKYNLQVLSFIRSLAWRRKNTRSNSINPIAMFRNYFKLTIRNLLKQKLFAVTNIASLSIGITCVALIYLFVADEYGFDKMHEKGDRVFRLNKVSYDASGQVVNQSSSQPFLFTEAIVDDLPEIEYLTKLVRNEAEVRVGNRDFHESILVSDQNIFNVFTIPLLHGDATKALGTKFSLVINEELAMKYFGRTAVVGEPIQLSIYGEFHEFTVTAVAEKFSSNNSVEFDMLVSFDYANSEGWLHRSQNWRMSFLVAYAYIPEKIDLERLKSKLPAIREAHYKEVGDAYANPDHTVTYGLQPLWDVHMNTQIGGVLAPSSDPIYSYILGAIAVVILLIAAINFTLLSLGRSAYRAKEIGLRKVIGANKNQLALQFQLEAIIISFLSLIFALCILYFVLPLFSDLAQKTLSFKGLLSPTPVAVLLLITICTGMFAGVYPAFVLSKLQTIAGLKNQARVGDSNWFSTSLLTAQFTLSIILVIATLGMGDQLHFLRSKHPGFNKEHLVVVDGSGADEKLYGHYITALNSDPNILAICGTNPAFTHGSWSSLFEYENEKIPYDIFFVDANYVETFQMALTAGRNFVSASRADSTEYILVNEAMVNALGWKDPVGRPITGLKNAGYRDPIIIGVVEDFNYSSLENEVGPAWLALSPPDHFSDLVIRISPTDIPGTIGKLEEVWNDFPTDQPFRYTFMEDDLNALYQSEERWVAIVKYSTILAMIVAALGLFSLMALSLASKVREIGIRKILGASMTQLLVLLSRNIGLRLVAAFVVAAPLAYYTLESWLSNFAYRVSLGIELFLIAAAVAFGIFSLTIVYTCLRAALANPVDSLREE